MYIKQVIIEGFLSYKERSIVSLDRQHTVVMGHNGSGKSNIYKAIEFVLSVGQNSAANYQHKGSKVNGKLTTFVELVVDNSDGFFNVEMDQSSDLHIRRSLIDSHDQYFINGVKWTKKSMVNLFETSGISTKMANYLVKEGQITEIAHSSDLYKLKLMYESIGGRQFDDCMKKYIRHLEKCETALETRSSRLQRLTNRQQSLEIEVGQGRRRKLLQQDHNEILYHLEALHKAETNQKIAELEQRRVAMHRECATIISEVCGILPQVVRARADCEEKNNELQLMCRQQEAHTYNIQGLTYSRTDLNIKLAKCQQELDDRQSKEDEKQRRRQEYDALREDIKQRKRRINNVLEQDNALKEEQHQLKLKLEELTATRSVLQGKQERCEKFGSKEERDRDINKRIESLDKIIKDIEEEIIPKAESEIESANKYEDNNIKNIKKLRGERKTLNKKLIENYELLHQLSKDIDETVYIITEITHEIRLIYAQYKAISVELPKIKLLYVSLPSRIWKGQQSMEEILGNYLTAGVNLGYHNQVIDNFTCDPKWYKALEAVAANGGLFCHIFERKKTVRRVLRKLKASEGVCGFLNMLSLDNINLPRRVDHPTYEMLLDKLTYDSKYDKVMQLCFGNTAIIENIEERNHRRLLRTGLNFVTINGAFLSSRGEYAPVNLMQHSTIEVIKRLQVYSVKYNSLKNKLVDKVKRFRDAFDYIKGLFANELPKIRQLEVQCKEKYDKFCLYEAEVSQIIIYIDDMEEYLFNCKEILRGYAIQRQKLQDEMKTPWERSLNADEEELLRVTAQKLSDLRKKIETNKEEISELNVVEQNKALNKHLVLLRKNEFLDLQEKDVDGEITRLREREALIEEKLQSEEQLLSDITRKILEETRLWDDLPIKVEKLKERHATSEFKLSTLQFQIAKSTEEMQMLKELPENDRQPPNANSADRFRNMDDIELNAELKRVGEQLRAYPQVNIAVVNQLQQLNEAVAGFLQRAAYQSESQMLLETMITSCYNGKHAVIEESLRRVTNEFKRIFAKFVTEGGAFIDFIRHDEEERDDASLTSSMHSDSGYSGVRIQVSFAAREVEKDMIRLSGGQKSVVSLAFLLALQTLNPSPVYLFDEVDQAMDPHYRAAFSEVVQELKEGAQFVTTSFWPEQIRHADKIFYVKCVKRASHVKEITLDQAEPILADRHH